MPLDISIRLHSKLLYFFLKFYLIHLNHLLTFLHYLLLLYTAHLLLLIHQDKPTFLLLLKPIFLLLLNFDILLNFSLRLDKLLQQLRQPLLEHDSVRSQYLLGLSIYIIYQLFFQSYLPIHLKGRIIRLHIPSNFLLPKKHIL